MQAPTYKMNEKVWLYSGRASWHFVNVNKKVSKKIKELFGVSGRGFGSIPVMVTVGKTSWKTSIFPDKKRCVYMLPKKADIGKKVFQPGKIFLYSIEIIF